MKMRPHPLRVLLASGLATHKLSAGPKPRVLLTFDDGPTPEVTAGVVERLAEAKARAAFFVVGEKVESSPDILPMVLAAGHAVGNHSHTHPNDRWPASSSYLGDIQRCNEAIENATGILPTLFRAPEGRLHPPSLWGSRRMGLQHVLWSLDSNDWTCSNGDEARQSAQRVLAEVRDGDIILLHEFDRWIWDLLDVLLPGLQTREFDLSTGLDDLS